jgi:hypothetical protein
VYKDGDTHGSWASQGVDAFYLGPITDHYRCDHYYIPETRAYRVSGSKELFPQHCQLTALAPHQHLCALLDELTEHTPQANNTPKGRRLLNKLVGTWIDNLLKPPLILDEQRMNKVSRCEACKAEQRLINQTPIITIPHISKAKPIMKLRNPMAKHVLKTTPWLHRWFTRNNTPGVMPAPC